MQRTVSLLALASLAVTITACSDGSRGPVTGNESRRLSLSIAQNTAGDEGSLMLDPRTATLHVGYGMLVKATITDENGAPLAGARPNWRSTNESVVRVSTLPDSGFANDGARAAVAGVSEGSALVIASYNGAADTARFTVAPPRVDSTGGGTTPRIPITAKKFEAGFYLSTAIDSTILAQWVREPVVNAKVRLVLLPLVVGDTVPPDVDRVTQPTLFAELTSNSDGFVIFQDVPMSRYRIEVTPPAPWKAWSRTYGPPYSAALRYHISLEKN